MTLQSQRELDQTRAKLRGLEELYAKTQADASESAYVRELTLRSLRQSINELKEEVTRFEARTKSPARDD